MENTNTSIFDTINLIIESINSLNSKLRNLKYKGEVKIQFTEKTDALNDEISEIIKQRDSLQVSLDNLIHKIIK